MIAHQRAIGTGVSFEDFFGGGRGMNEPTDAVLPEDAESAMRVMLMQLLDPLVDLPEQCSVETVPLDGATMFVVRVAPPDMHRFLGQNVRTARSLQTIVSAVGAKSQRRFTLRFEDDVAAGKRSSDVLPETAKT
jgi:predicted RNA-binding protein YlqC (UPF0109 family)